MQQPTKAEEPMSRQVTSQALETARQILHYNSGLNDLPFQISNRLQLEIAAAIDEAAKPRWLSPLDNARLVDGPCYFELTNGTRGSGYRKTGTFCWDRDGGDPVEHEVKRWTPLPGDFDE